jgi:hypothetical protein
MTTHCQLNKLRLEWKVTYPGFHREQTAEPGSPSASVYAPTAFALGLGSAMAPPPALSWGAPSNP